MKRSKRLGTVLQIAAQRKREAEQRLGLAQQAVVDEKNKLEQLKNYLQDYQQSLIAEGQQGVPIEVLRRMQSFKDRLLVAIEQQQQAILAAEFNLGQAKQTWQAIHGRHRAIGTLQERVADQERQAEDKQAQKQVDELVAARRFYQGGNIED